MEKFEAENQIFCTGVCRRGYGDFNKKTELFSFKALGGVRTESLKMIFRKRASQGLPRSAGIRYGITLLMLLHTLNITLLYTTLTITSL